MDVLTGPCWTIYIGDVRDGLARLQPGSVHAAVTSPPYWRLRDYGVAGQLGMESTPQDYVINLASIFARLWDILREDATLWVNIGDTYIGKGGGGAGGTYGAERRAYRDRTVRTGSVGGFKTGELALVPERFSIAMQSTGWWLRSRITWHKRNAMPESAPDRCGRDDEPLFMLARGRKHYFDRLGVTFPASANTHSRGHGLNPKAKQWDEKLDRSNARFRRHVNGVMSVRRCRTTWDIPTVPYRGAHFAAFPPALPERCLRLTTSRAGCCPICGSPLRRMVHSVRKPTRPGNATKLIGEAADSAVSGNRDPERHVTDYVTTGWEPTCRCVTDLDHNYALPVVLDPFAGVCSTGVAALRLGCRFIGCELNPEYAQAGHQRLLAEWAQLQLNAQRDRRPQLTLLFEDTDE
jgi:DNA modification methylase